MYIDGPSLPGCSCNTSLPWMGLPSFSRDRSKLFGFRQREDSGYSMKLITSLPGWLRRWRLRRS